MLLFLLSMNGFIWNDLFNFFTLWAQLKCLASYIQCRALNNKLHNDLIAKWKCISEKIPFHRLNGTNASNCIHFLDFKKIFLLLNQTDIQIGLNWISDGGIQYFQTFVKWVHEAIFIDFVCRPKFALHFSYSLWISPTKFYFQNGRTVSPPQCNAHVIYELSRLNGLNANFISNC